MQVGMGRAAAVAVVTMAMIGTSAAESVAAPQAPAAASNSPHSAYRVHSLHKVGPSASAEVLSIDKHANKACDKADHLFYTKPKKGYVYVVVQFRVKKLSKGRKQTVGDMIITNLLAKDGKPYGQLYSGAVAPHDAASSKKVKKGHSSHGGFVYMVKKSDVKAGHLKAIVETTDSSTTPYYFKT